MSLQLKKSDLLLRVMSVFLCLFSITILSQELPPIQNFIPKNYNAGNQNWMISQDSKNRMFIANNEGLLTYNGSKWKLYPSPNKTIIRSVKVVNDVIYTGSFMEFGFWKTNDFGNLKYTSLLPKLPKKMSREEYFWRIVDYDNWIIFQSNSNMYIYDTTTKKISVFKIEVELYRIYKVNNQLYYQLMNNAIYTINQGVSKLVVSSDLIKTLVINIFKQDDKLLIITESSNIFEFDKGKLTPWKLSENVLKDITIYSAIKLKDNSFVFGTISNGILHIDPKGKLLHHINRTSGLSNNTVLSLFEDANQNLWIGLDNGIDLVNLKSPITIYNDKNGKLGTVYCSIVYKNYLYLGTNQGLFYKKNNSTELFRIISNTEGQVWSLVDYKEQLFCGHNSGVFIVNKSKAQLISSVNGVWDLKTLPKVEDELLLGTYNGLVTIHKKNGEWKLKNRIKGFDVSSRSLEFTTGNTLWVNHEYKGLYKLTLDENFENVKTIVLDTVFSKTNNSSIALFNNELFYASKKGVFKYKSKKNEFIKDTLLSRIISNGDYVSGKLINDDKKLWSFSKNNIAYMSLNQLTNAKKINSIPISSSLRKGMIGFENITKIDKDSYLLGTSNGYLKINNSILLETNLNIQIDNVFKKNFGKPLVYLNRFEYNTLKNADNTIGFDFSVTNYNKFSSLQFQYKLNGLFEKWSSWSNKTSIFFENLKPNEYTFSVRAKLDGNITKSKEHKFKIKKPWYLSITALGVYVLMFILIGYFINKILKWYYSKENKHKELTNNQLVMEMSNDKLNQEIDNKNRELAISTMSLVRKNKVLSSIKKELMIIDKTKYSEAISLIDKSLNSKKDWKFFERAFNNADKDFLTKLKKMHSNLTPNDLRFSAFLRLNLSSKELAPLLNISYRSVEIKRYRLRKKLNLAHETSLIEYILNI
ncbi:MAG: triple tyrosine motif-containing protein [Flavobacteriaceae bacterium]